MRSLACLFLVFAVAACGGGEDDPSGGGTDVTAMTGSKEDVAKAVVTRLLRLAKAGDNKAAAGLIAYRGREDKKRRWTDSSNYANEDEKRYVDRVCKEVAGYADMGGPVFEKFHAEKKSEGEWLVWKVKFGTKTVHFACINNAGKTLLGDID